MIVHDSDKIQITEESDGTLFMALDTGNETAVTEIEERELEDLFDNLVDHFAKKAEGLIDSDTLKELQEEDSGRVLSIK